MLSIVIQHAMLDSQVMLQFDQNLKICFPTAVHLKSRLIMTIHTSPQSFCFYYLFCAMQLFSSSFVQNAILDINRDGFSGGCGGGVHTLPWPDGVQGGCYFHNKAGKYDTVSIMIDSFITADSFSSLDVWTV